MSALDPWQSRLTTRDLGTIAREQHQGRPLAELAPWLFPLRENVIVNKDSGLMACLEFDGVDTDGASQEQLIGLAASMNKLLIYQQEEPLMLWWTVRRTRTTDYPDSEFPDPISKGIDDSRRAAFLAGQNYINRHYLSTVLQAHAGVARLKERLAYALKRGHSLSTALVNAAKTLLDDQRIFAYTPPELHEAGERLEHVVADMTGMLPDLRFRRLAGADLGAFLHATISPQAGHQEKLDLTAMSLDASPNELLDEALPEGTMMPARDFLHFSGYRQKFTVAVTISAYTDELKLGALDRLYSIPGEITINYALRLMPLAEAEKHAEVMRNYHENRKWSWKSTVKAVADGVQGDSPTNPGRERMAAQAKEALGLITQGKLSGLWFYFCVLCHGDTLQEADDLADRVDAILRGAHLRPEREELHLVSAFATSIPGMWKECARWRFFNSKAFSMIAPVHTISRGEPDCRHLAEQTRRPTPALAVLPTDYATPYYYNIFLRDLGHGFIVGPAGAGKSSFGNFVWSQFRRYPDAQVAVFDKDLSSRIPIMLQGGSYLDFSSDDASVRFNPIARLSADNFEWTAGWIELLLQQRGYQLGAEDSKDLEASLRATMDITDPKLKRLSTVYSQLGRANLRKALEPWVGSRVQARYFDNEDDGFDLGSGLVGTEVGKLLTNEQVAIPMMEYCFERIDSMLRDQRAQGIVRPTFIYLAEVWHLLRKEYYRDKLNDWLKTLRKRCAVVWMDTQSPEDMAESGIFASLRDNIPNRIFLPNRNALSESLYQVYRREFELTHNQIERIAGGVQKRDYLIQQGHVSRMVQLRFSPDTLACLRSDMAAQIVFDKHYRSGAADWKERYIQEVQGV